LVPELRLIDINDWLKYMDNSRQFIYRFCRSCLLIKFVTNIVPLIIKLIILTIVFLIEYYTEKEDQINYLYNQYNITARVKQITNLIDGS
jgi:hypothetical protein